MKRMIKLFNSEVVIELLTALMDSPQDVTSIANKLELDLTTISRCLKQMHAYMIVKVQRDKTRHVYSLGSGVDVVLNCQFIYITAQTADGGEISLKVPAPRK